MLILKRTALLYFNTNQLGMLARTQLCRVAVGMGAVGALVFEECVCTIVAIVFRDNVINVHDLHPQV